MSVPESELARVKRLAETYRHYFVPVYDDYQFLMRIGKIDPCALDPVALALIANFNEGNIISGNERGLFNWLNSMACLSEHLRELIMKNISLDTLEYYTGDHVEADIRTFAQQLSDTLKLERPRHYFDLCRGILTDGGSVFIIGAGFSYDSYAPLVREMEGIACSVLDDLGVSNSRDFYHQNENEAWRLIAEGWKVFQKHVTYMLLPKEPSEQHRLLAELFHEGYVRHIVSFNWDDLVEKAHKQLYGTDIQVIREEGPVSDHALWKPHGDISTPSERWVLPYEDGRVFPVLEEIARETTLRTFVIGYREQEPEVRRKLIETLERRGGITRIRLDATDKPPDSFSDNALMAMRKIKSGIESAKKNQYPS